MEDIWGENSGMSIQQLRSTVHPRPGSEKDHKIQEGSKEDNDIKNLHISKYAFERLVKNDKLIKAAMDELKENKTEVVKFNDF